MPGPVQPAACPFIRLRATTIAVVASALVGGCTAGEALIQRRSVRIMTSNPTAEYYAVGEALSKVYDDTMPDVRTSILPSQGGNVNVSALEDGSAELAFAGAETAYEAFVRGTPVKARPHTRLRGIAVLFAGALQIVVAPNSRIRTIADLRGAEVGFTVATSDTPVQTVSNRFKLVELVASTHGLAARDVRLVVGTPDEIRAAMLARKLDAWFVLAGYPIAKVSTLYPDEGLRLLEIGPRAASEIRARAPFYKPVVLPAGTYPGQANAVRTIGSENLLVCRSDLDDGLVYRLTRHLFEALPRLAEAHSALHYIDPDVAAATPIPLHPGAAQYYRERQLFH
ncbi:MAG: TAXI family TRAP transporter solute-binding subunit [Vicinamibacterales bacterium]